MTICPICGATINEGVEICPKCHARLMPPLEKIASAPQKREQAPPKLKTDVSIPEEGVPPTIHAIEQSVAQVHPTGSEVPPTSKPPVTQEKTTIREQPAQAPKTVPQPAAQQKPASGPNAEPEGAAVHDSEKPGAEEQTPEKESREEPGKADKGYPAGGSFPGWPYGNPYGYYMPFPSDPRAGYEGYQRGIPPEDSQATHPQSLLPVPGYQMPPPMFPFFPGWPYPPIMIVPAGCYPFQMQQGMYPQPYGGYGSPGLGPQYPPTAQSSYPPRYRHGAQVYDVPRKKRMGPFAVIMIVLLVLAVLAGGGLGAYFLLQPANSSFDLGSSSVPGEDIELKNMKLNREKSTAVLTGTYENQSSRKGEVLVSINVKNKGAQQTLNYTIPISAKKTDNFSLSQATQGEFSDATLGSILFESGTGSSYDDSSSDSNSNSDSGTYPWQDESGTVPSSDTETIDSTNGTSPSGNGADLPPWAE